MRDLILSLNRKLPAFGLLGIVHAAAACVPPPSAPATPIQPSPAAPAGDLAPTGREARPLGLNESSDDAAMARQEGRAMGMTPAREQGIDVRFEETSDGAAVRFTVTPASTPPRVASLRTRVEGWALRHQRLESSAGLDARPKPAEPDECANGGPLLPRSRVVAEQVDDGARLRFIAMNGHETANLRAAIKRYAERVETGDCRLIGQP